LDEVKGNLINEHVQGWLAACLDGSTNTLRDISNIKNGVEREVWDCAFIANRVHTEGILTIFKPGTQETVNTNLPPKEVVEKCALAMKEIDALGITTPKLLGHTEIGDQAGLLCEKVNQRPWNPADRIHAARLLARLHTLPQDNLSDRLQELIEISDPREYRTTGGLAPKAERKVLVHGDFFSANILPASEGLCIIDWETFGRGDPMWDLGFLIGADRDLPEDEIRMTIKEYEKIAPVNHDQLLWHQNRWLNYWQKMNLGDA
jgi:hypothetical protein